MFNFDHVHLRSLDPEAAARFYVEMLGARITGRSGQGGSLRVVLDLHGVTLFVDGRAAGAPGQGEPAALDHLALSVRGFDAAVATLRARGAVFAVEPFEPRPGVRAAFVAGPDGARIEVLERDARTAAAPAVEASGRDAVRGG